MSSSEKLKGLRILLVEDNYLIATEVRAIVSRLGCVVVGPVASVEEGNHLAEIADLDGAILDINIVGGDSSTIAQTLARRGHPFFFLTGYGDASVFKGVLSTGKHIRKPVTAATIEATMLEIFAPASASAPAPTTPPVMRKGNSAT